MKALFDKAFYQEMIHFELRKSSFETFFYICSYNMVITSRTSLLPCFAVEV